MKSGPRVWAVRGGDKVLVGLVLKLFRLASTPEQLGLSSSIRLKVMIECIYICKFYIFDS